MAPLEIDPDELHAALRDGLRIPAGYGERSKVARALTERLPSEQAVSRQRYSNIMRGADHRGLDVIERWCRVAGVRIVLESGQAFFVVIP